MNNYGVVLKKLRIANRLTIKEAATKIQKSTGWIFEVENGKGAARLHPEEFERVVVAYDGEAYRKQFGPWLAKAKLSDGQLIGDSSFGGSVLKYLRNKANMSLAEAAKQAELSRSYLSYVETGQKPLSANLRDRLMRIYGYSPTSFKNFASEDKRAKNVPVRYKLDAILKQVSEEKIEQIFEFAFGLMSRPKV